MRSIPVAMTVDYLKRARITALCVLLYMIGVPALFCVVMVWQGLPAPDVFGKAPLGLSALLVPLFGFMLVVWMGQRDKHFGVTGRMYVLPLPTWQLAALRMLQAGITVGLLCLVTMEANKLLFGLTWPSWGPVLAMAVMAMWLQAAYWTLLDFRLWKLAAVAAVFTAIVWWVASRLHPNGFYEPAETWTGPTQTESLTLAAAALLAGVTSAIAIGRHRRGDFETPAAWALRRFGALELRLAEPRTFASPEAAMLWLEWTRRGVVMPALYGALMIVSILVGAVRVWLDWSRPIDVLEFQLALALLVQPQLAGVIGLAIGHRNQSSSRVEIDSYSATRPVSVAAMSNAVLRSSARAVLLGYLVMAVLIVPMGLWVLLQDGPQGLKSLQEMIPDAMLHSLGAWCVVLVLGASLLATWASVGLAASLVFVGQSRFLAGVLFASLGTLVVWVIAINHIVAPELRPGAGSLSAGLLGLACLGSTIWAFWRAIRDRHLRPQTAWLAGIGWLSLCVLLVIVWQVVPANPPSHSWLALPLLPGLLALPFAPLATAPLALAWNRHR